MPIIFSVVSRGLNILTKHASLNGNFEEVIQHILIAVPQGNIKCSYAQDPYLFHCITRNGITYMCITDNRFLRSTAFLFLNQIKKRFEDIFIDGTTVTPDVINTEFSSLLEFEMKRFSSSNVFAPLPRVNSESGEFHLIINRDTDDVHLQGEHQHLLVNDETDAIEDRTIGGGEAQSTFWANVPVFYLLLAVVHVIVVYFLISLICGGLAWKKCV